MATAKRPYVNVDVSRYMPADVVHAKDMIVLHETVSHDRKGLSDITGVASYLGQKGYGIHLLVDQEGKSGYSRHERAVYSHAAGGVNTRSIGIELISWIPALPFGVRFGIWLGRQRQNHKTARWLAYYSKVHRIPLRYSDSSRPGVTTHWSVTMTNHVSGGHTDCYPKHLGGYYPVKRVIRLAKAYKAGSLVLKPMSKFKLGKSV